MLGNWKTKLAVQSRVFVSVVAMAVSTGSTVSIGSMDSTGSTGSAGFFAGFLLKVSCSFTLYGNLLYNNQRGDAKV